MRFVLRNPEGSTSYYKIYQGRKWVGRVWQHVETKRFHGLINTSKGRIEAEGGSAKEAFEAVASKALGFNNAAEVRANNAAVRYRNKQSKARAQYTLDEMMRGNFEPFEKVLLGRK